MKPFDLEAAKAGIPICDRDGNMVKFIVHVPEADLGSRVIVLVGEEIRCYREDGIYYHDGEECDLDLFMAPKKKIVWVNFHPGIEQRAYFYETEQYANKFAHHARIGGKAYPVEIDV